jgi:hypothetical protein
VIEPLHDLPELRALLDALCEETITPEQVSRLEQLVLTHPEAEAYYVQYLSQHADLVCHFSVLPARTEQALRERVTAAPATHPARAGRLRLVWAGVGLTGLAAGVLLALTLGRWLAGDSQQSPGRGPEASDNTVAVLLQAAGTRWEDTGLPTRAGAALPPGWLRLKSGLAHLEFYNGATVVLEGPAELQLISRTQAYCARGKLRAVVPPGAYGFTIGSPAMDLVDRGTEFGLDVGAGGRTEVHVFQGKVELYEPASTGRVAPRHELTTGQGVRLDGPGEARPIPTNPDAFSTVQQLAARSQAEIQLRQRQWLEASKALCQDPSLQVYYTFEADRPGGRTLLDRSRERKDPRDGAIVGCAWVDGRWPGRQGLEFKRVTDRVRLNVPGKFESLTLVAWVRVDGLPNLNDSLLMADGWAPGTPHWQLRDDGTLILGVQSDPKGRGAHYHAREVFTPARFGQWAQVAVTYDREAGLVSHYVDGRPVAQEATHFDIPLRIGNAELGNWNIASHRNPSPVRFFSGRMDEFMMFSRALTEAEIERLYEQGRPPS